ncbi:MAG: phosphatase PAP2 family protein [Bacteroidales bacterium]|nr:phosphatase PAP2 family protein [Bacteroidales bacterium]
MLQWLEYVDITLFLWINRYHTSWADVFFWYVSNKYVWIPFYMFFIWLIFKKYPRHGWIILLGGIFLITVTDQASVHLFKNVFQRYRPCHNLNLKEHIHLVNNKCGGLYGFISSHAANSTAFATYVFLWLMRQIRRKKIFFFTLLLYVFLIGYSRIYLGQHYPFDVIGGMTVGAIVAIFFYYLTKKKLIPLVK